MIVNSYCKFVICSDPVSRSGMFCAIATTIERCKTEAVVDVFQVVKALRLQKPGAVANVVSMVMLMCACVNARVYYDPALSHQLNGCRFGIDIV